MMSEAARREWLSRWLFSLLALVVPALVGYTILNQWRTPMLGFSHDGSASPLVTEVFSGGAAEAAGLHAGDIILSANDLPFGVGYDRQSGQTYAMEIVRGDERLTLTVLATPMLQSNRWQLVSAVVVALTFWGSSILLLRRRFHRKDLRLLCLAFQTFAVTVLPGLAYPRFRLPPPWMVFLEFACFYLAVLLFLHYHLTFPVVLGTPRQRRWTLGLLYGLTLMTAVDGLSRATPWTRLTAFYTVVECAVAIGVVVYVYFRRATADGRLRLRVVVAGTVLGLAPPLLGYVIPTFVQGYTPDVPRWLVCLFLVIVPLSYLYAIARHNLFGIDRLLNRALVYTILSLGIFVLCLGPLLLLSRYLPDEWLAQATAVSGMALLVGLTFDQLRTEIQRLVDRLFYGGWYDYPGVVETVSEALTRSLDREQLVHVLTNQVPALMQLHAGQMWIGEPGATPQEKITAPQLRFPLSFQGQVHGLWTTGPRRDGENLTTTDRRILQTLASQAEVALSNVLLVEALRRRLEEIREAQHELLRSREEERARLARDLHDGPIQALVGLNLQLGWLLPAVETPPLIRQDSPQMEALQAMRAEVRDLLAELRQVCAELRPPMLDTVGLGAALRALAEDWSGQHGVETQLDLPPDAALRPLTGEVSVNLYRVAQEALTNVARHAAARQVTMRLGWENACLTLTVQDDGCGFAVPTPLQSLTAQGHFGLAGMQERAELIGGTLTVESAPGQGTMVRVDQEARNVNRQFVPGTL
jgi:signal transduction histidine kinase